MKILNYLVSTAGLTRLMTILQWIICISVLLFGALDTGKEYIRFQEHPEWSAPAYLVLLKLIPYLVVVLVIFAILQYIKRH